MEPMDVKEKIKDWAGELGFDRVRIAKAGRLDEEAEKLREWLDLGYHGEMKYMENHFEKRVDPGKLVPGAKSVIVLSYNYYTDKEPKDPQAPKVSIYAYGRDYHLVIRKKLNELMEKIKDHFIGAEGRGFVDSAPVMERDWAARSGLGWKGKHTLLIHPQRGSYFFLACLITNLELEADAPIKDYCGTCTKCIDACPTDAIDSKGYLLDARKCISYLTIELKSEEIPGEFEGKMEDRMFGCDICQEVCPWNKFSEPHSEPAFEPHPDLLEMKRSDWEDLDSEKFNELFRKSAVKRTKFKGLKRNIDFLNQ